MLGKSLVITFHYSQSCRFIHRHRMSFQTVLRATNRMILVSKEQQDSLKKVFPSLSHKTIVIPNGYDADRYRPMDRNECRIKLGLPFDKKILLDVSNLVESKGHAYLIDAVKKILPCTKDILCIIVGLSERDRCANISSRRQNAKD